MSVREVTIAAVSLGLFLMAGAVTAQQPRESLVTQGARALPGARLPRMSHGREGREPIAPDLSRTGVKHTEAHLARWLRDPSAQRPTAHMPKLELSEAEVQALAAFLASLRGE